MTVLLSESASLTARETLTVLGMRGHRADVLTSGALTLGRFSRWRGRSVAAPAASRDPLGYLAAVGELVRGGRYEAVLPTHEQAWLFAAGRSLLPADAPIAVSSVAAFERVQGKLDFAGLLDELGVPQPRWWRAADPPGDVPYPHWVKASHGTAGRGVRLVSDAGEARRAAADLAGDGDPVMGQAPAPGRYGQVQALFQHGRMVAVHTSVAIGSGMGGSAAARLSVDHEQAREHVDRVGAHLAWHGGLTLDYFSVDGRPQFIECNPRTVEPANAASAGVDLPALTIALSTGAPLPDRVVVGRPGVRTRSALALALGAAERHGDRAAVLRVVRDCVLGRGELGHATEVLTPVLRDPASALPAAVLVARLLARPGSAPGLAAGAVAGYAVPPASVRTVRQACGS